MQSETVRSRWIHMIKPCIFTEDRKGRYFLNWFIFCPVAENEAKLQYAYSHSAENETVRGRRLRRMKQSVFSECEKRLELDHHGGIETKIEKYFSGWVRSLDGFVWQNSVDQKSHARVPLNTFHIKTRLKKHDLVFLKNTFTYYTRSKSCYVYVCEDS
jgi:hypothetical protein